MERYQFVNRFGTASSEYGYNLRVCNRQGTALAVYSCKGDRLSCKNRLRISVESRSPRKAERVLEYRTLPVDTEFYSRFHIYESIPHPALGTRHCRVPTSVMYLNFNLTLNYLPNFLPERSILLNPRISKRQQKVASTQNLSIRQ